MQPPLETKPKLRDPGEFQPLGNAARPDAAESIAFEEADIRAKLLDLDEPCYFLHANGRIGATHAADRADRWPVVAIAPSLPLQTLGDPGFLDCYGVKAAYAAGAMAGGIASEALVIALGQAQLLGFFGTGGLPLARIEAAIQQIQQALPQGPYGFNLLHNPNNLAAEQATVDLYLRYQVRAVEASAFLDLTPSIVCYRAAGLDLDAGDRLIIRNKVVAKLSRREVAAKFLQPAPAKILQELVARGAISQLQATLAEKVPLADDITVEADSGGHTDNRPLVCLLPSILQLRDELQARYAYAQPVRIGVAGGIGTPQAALAAFMMGAAYVVTGSVNQACVEAGACAHTKQLLAKAGMADVMMAPAADMFEMGVKLQVLKKGTLFGLRAQKLYELYKSYDSIEAIPQSERDKIEKQIFQQRHETEREKTDDNHRDRNPRKLARATDNPKLKMSLIFRWYLGLSSRWSTAGEKGREIDYQIWCGPAMGAFNDWVRGSYLEESQNRHVVEVSRHILTGAALLYRLQTLRAQGLRLPLHYGQYRPVPVNN